MERRAVKKEEFDLESAVTGAQSGDRAAIEKLVEWIQDELFAFCFYLARDRARAEDLCQETLIKALENIVKLKERAKFKSWVFTSARHLFLDELKSHDQRTLPISDENETASGADEEHNLAIREALLLLSPEERLILVLVDLNSFSYAEAAKIMGLTEDAVTSRLFRARQNFLKKF